MQKLMGEGGFSVWQVILEGASGASCGSSQETQEVGTMGVCVGGSLSPVEWAEFIPAFTELFFNSTTSTVPS